MRELRRAGRAEREPQPAVVGQRVADPVQHEPVVGPAREQARRPQQHAGERRVERRRAEQRERVQRRVRLLRRDHVRVQHAAREQLHEQAHRQHDEHVAGNRRRLRADQRDDRRDERLHAFVVAGVVELARERRRGHRGLLGRESEVQEVHQHEAGRVVDACEQAFEHRLQVRAGNRELHAHRRDRDEAAAGGHPQHLQILGAAARDVVLAGVRIGLDELAREQREVAAHEVRHALAVLVRVDQLGRQARHPAQVVARHPRVEQRLGAQDAHAHPLDLEHDVDRHAVAVQMREHVVDRDPAFVEQHAQVVHLVQQLARVAAVLDGRVRGLDREHRAREPVERLRLERLARIVVGQAAAHRLRQAGRADLAGQVVQRGQQVARERAGLVTFLFGDVERDQLGEAREQVVGQRVDPLRVFRRREHQREQRRQLAAVRRGRDQRRIDPFEQRAEEAGMDRHAGVAQQRDAVALAQDAAQDPRGVRLPRGIAVEHVEQVAQPRMGRIRARVVVALDGVLCGLHRAAAPQPVRELDQPFAALGVRRVGVGMREQRVELVARTARRAPLLDQGRQGTKHKAEIAKALDGRVRDAGRERGAAPGRTGETGGLPGDGRPAMRGTGCRGRLPAARRSGRTRPGASADARDGRRDR
ncbi:hypothetical protein FEP99_04125 [Burkholderia pseudomultivorans]|uniref:Uncharacterized protein n=1 Tax=Burkholderia pseudomultivorans TaxID=1207504 RepID=A0ABU2E9K7_9BURK|nr:hypothetical protein [Burkholderia pseudomultivorans]MDR8851099.1 hypothetical protein [Burkholderia pseudomultivorans]